MTESRNDSREEAFRRACRRVAVYLKDIWDNSPPDARHFIYRVHSRVINVMIWSWRDGTALGNSVELEESIKSGNPKERRTEHLVPLRYLLDCSAQMFQAGKTVEDVTDMLQRYYRTASITKDEAVKLDSKELGLKLKMPTGWHWENGDVMARLNAAKIELYRK